MKLDGESSNILSLNVIALCHVSDSPGVMHSLRQAGVSALILCEHPVSVRWCHCAFSPTAVFTVSSVDAQVDRISAD